MPNPAPHRKFQIFAAFAQGFFCVVMGLWPVADRSAFLSLTGLRADPYSLTLAGLLLAGIGASMVISAIRRDIAFEVFAIGLVTALSLAGTDIFFVIERSIPVLYLLDAVAESLFVTLWVFAIRDLRRARQVPAAPAPPAAVGTTTTTAVPGRGETDATG